MNGLAVPADGGTLRLGPEGTRIALIRPRQAFEQGDRAAVTLRFERARAVSIAMPVHGR